MSIKYVFSLWVILSFFSCTQERRNSPDPVAGSFKLFKEISSSQSKVEFNNKLIENERYNFMTEQGMLIGAGVGILDINNDGLPDIYFAANMSQDKLYLNKGNFEFEDVSKAAGIADNFWSTGVSVVDINSDGYDDIYVCQYIENDPNRRANILYINNKNGGFSNQAATYGIDDTGHSIMANFFDYDRDGDLDLYLANQPPNSRAFRLAYKGVNDFQYTDKLYRNDGAKFTDVTNESGIKNYSYSLSATTIDYNNDGWPDIYVANDYEEPDFFYKNNGNGTFTNVADDALKHISNFSMGADVADINNDGHLDIYVADMVAEDNYRQKTNMSGMNPERFFKLAEVGYHYQYMANVLQLANGDNSFSDIAHLAGVSNTDWSWSPLFVDADQDGYKDLFVTNGIFREIRNKDFEKWRVKWFEEYQQAQAKGNTGNMNPMDVIAKAPSVKLANYAFLNKGDLTFEHKSTEWGMDKPTWSQGSAYADFDQDGDLDLVMNNTNSVAGLYKNLANENRLNNYLSISLEGARRNKNGINATIELTTSQGTQLYEYTPYRGYMSSSQRIAHFGIGKDSEVAQVRVTWSDNKMNVLSKVSANQNLIIKHSEAKSTKVRGQSGQKTIFQDYPHQVVKHIENNFDDYKNEILLPYKTSCLGPAIATADVNGDGKEDLFLGGSVSIASRMLISNNTGGYSTKEIEFSERYEDGGATFFDVDGDQDLDLYVTSGGNEYELGTPALEDRLYLNDGKGQFKFYSDHPELDGSNAKVISIDIDDDGDLDLFVAGRLIPQKYGAAADSHLLINENGMLKETTDQKWAFLKQLGMVTDIKVADLNSDGKLELVIVGEWMPIKVYSLGQEIKDLSTQYNLDKTEGWWNCIEIADIDGDGDKDLVAGNLGTNIKYKATAEEPFTMFVDDFDKNGSNDVYLGYYEDGKCFPVRGRQCSSEQMPYVSEKYATYESFGVATITEVIGDKLSESTIRKEAFTFESTAFINDGNQFTPKVLPNAAQVSPIYGIAVDDFDKDGTIDFFVAGNMYQREVETTRSDAGKGCMISLEKDGEFSIKNSFETGISADKDVRAVTTLSHRDKKLLVVANNNGPIEFYSY